MTPAPAMGATNQQEAAMADDTPTPDDDAPDESKPPADTLGDPGKKALEAERKARREADRQRAELEKRLKELEDRDKSETEKLSGRLTEAEQRAHAAESRALRLEVAAAKGLTPAQAKRLVGTTQEELEADADEILAEFAPHKGEESDDARRRPREKLRSGAAPEADEEIDIADVVSRVSRF